MHSDPVLSDRLRTAVSERGFVERFFFGGVAFFLNGNFSVGVYHQQLVLRIGPNAADEALERPYVKPMDITGRPMRGWVLVESEGFETNQAIDEWINQVFDFVSTLPIKTGKKESAKKRKGTTASPKRTAVKTRRRSLR